MATTSFLYHSMGLRGYKHLRTEYRGGAIFHHVQRIHRQRRCRACNARWHHLTLDGSFRRTFHGLPAGTRPQFVVLHGHEQYCKRCEKSLREPIFFAVGSRRYTKAFGRFVLELCALMPIKSVASLLNVSWDLVKDLYKEQLRIRLKRRKLSKIRYIAVDEFAVHKGHRYMTVVLDLESGAILHAHEGREIESLLSFLKFLKRRRAKLQAVAMDMWKPYQTAVVAVFGDKVDVVHDPYHVVAQANRAIDKIRQKMLHEFKGESRKVLKGSRFLLLKGLEKQSPRSLERLMLLMEFNEPLYQAYLLKEDLRMFWSLPDRKSAESFIEIWLEEARSCGLGPFNKLAKTIKNHLTGLLSYFKHRISTGPLEGLNNKIKVLKRQAYGFRDMEYLKLRLYFLHDATPAFPG